MDGRKENHGAEGRGAHREGSAGEQGGESGALEKGRAAQSRGEACEGCRQQSVPPPRSSEHGCPGGRKLPLPQHPHGGNKTAGATDPALL